MKLLVNKILAWFWPKPTLTAWHAQQMMQVPKNLTKAVENRIEEEAAAGFGFALLSDFKREEIAEIQEEFEQRGFVVENGLIRWQ